MIRQLRIRKAIAVFFLTLLTTETLLPATGYALTDGPQQPEATKFQPAGTSELVDLFTGDFKYNIPLLDIDGYPVNLSYHAGAGMDEEASWVGLGWSLNAGAITRQLRGLPDDMAGDWVTTEQYLKQKVTTGGRGTVRAEILGKGRFGLTGSMSLGVFNDSYTGMGAEFGANAGLSYNITNGSRLTLGMGLSAKLGIGVNSNTSDGVSVSPSLSLSVHERKQHFIDNSIGISANLSYNTREGLKERTMALSFATTLRENPANRSGDVDVFGETVGYSTPAYYPSPAAAFKTTNRTYSIDLGGSAFGIYGGVGLTGYQTRRDVDQPVHRHHAYGMLYAERSAKDYGALLDFMREKDNPVIPNLPSLAIPIATPDLFSYTSQSGGGQFRVYRGGTGVFYDAQTKDLSDNITAGGDFGFGGYFHNGVSFYKQEAVTQTGKWTRDNNFLNTGDFSFNKTGKSDEYAYFKEIGEQNGTDAGFTAQLQGEKPVAVRLNGKFTTGGLKDDYGVYPVTGSLKKTGRQIRSNSITYLTADEANAAFDKKIISYPFNPYNESVPFSAPACSPQPLPGELRTSTIRKAHHISEITVHGKDGGRMIYGIPVYNNSQDEYSFAVDNNVVKAGGPDIVRNLIPVKTNTQTNSIDDHYYGTDHYYRHETQPAYATSFLLTGIFSADYEDLTNNGITPDDPGTAIKFNYSKIKGYRWRTPIQAGMASLNRGLLADPDDDKGNIITGEKDLWYMHSIESRNYIAYFITDDREDGLGVTDLSGTINTAVRQKRLREIRLYSKEATPKLLKTVVFHYDYKLCPGAPNNLHPGQGKLTLTGIHFEYQNSGKGGHYPYQFEYKQNEAVYTPLSSDRWGTYKSTSDNGIVGFGTMRNDEFPYTISNKERADLNAGMWQLSKITLPTGGEINVEYESDDYAYVQDRRAMEMSGITDLLSGEKTVTTSLLDARGFRVKVDGIDATTKMDKDIFIRDYLDGQESMYAKLCVNVSDEPNSSDNNLKDFVPAYGKVSAAMAGNGFIDVFFEQDQGHNPFIMAAWQKMRLEYQRYAYPGYKNKLGDEVSIEAALAAIVNAIGNLREITENFNQRAARKKFATQVNLQKSVARIVNKFDGGRLGGGARVKKIKLKDNWDQMATGGVAATYGQQYEYRMIDTNGDPISSGVASYEPLIGADENPNRLPVKSYSQDFKWTLSNYFYLEEPYGESLFPAALVGYRKVSVYSLGADEQKDPENKTGYTVSEFYTAKDFPVIVNYTKPVKYNYQPSSWFSFFGGNVIQELIMSQGYSLILNDMHGKLKANRTFNQSGHEIASELYEYNAEPMGATTSRLINKVNTIDEKGTITNDEVIGREIEMYTDMREQESSITGTSVNIGLDVIPFIFGTTLPLPHWPFKENNEYRLFRSASTLKAVQYFGVLSKVTKKVDDAVITSTNLLFDKTTGSPVVVQTQNEFGDPVYTVNVPAYWINKGMGAAYQNEGMLINGFSTSIAGVINGVAASYLGIIGPGDELRDLRTGKRLWIVQTPVGELVSYRVIDETGHLVRLYSGNVKVLHSGYTNKLESGAMSIVCKENPLAGNVLGILSNADMASFKVLNASVVLYNEDWGAAGKCSLCPDGYEYKDGKCSTMPLMNPADSLKPVEMPGDTVYSMYGARYYNSDGTTAVFPDNYWSPVCGTNSSRMVATKDSCGVLSRVGLWLNTGGSANWKGLEDCFTAPSTGTYYLGFAADNRVRIFIDGVYKQSREAGTPEEFYYWNIYPIELTAGNHAIRIEMKNDDAPSGKRSMGVEIYNVSYSQLQTGDWTVILSNRIFTTEWLRRDPEPKIQTFSIGFDASVAERYTAAAGDYNPCTRKYEIISDSIVNPYLKGFLGDWHPSEELVTQSLRVNQTVGVNTYAGANIRNTGQFTSFIPYWYCLPGSGLWTSTATSTASNWKSARKITLYSPQGAELENRDPLGNYSAALYGYKNSLPVAVASNSRQREIFYDGFEDYLSSTACAAVPCTADKFSIRNQWTPATTGFKPVTTEAHSGWYSLSLSASVTLNANIHTREHRSTNYVGINNSGLYHYRTDIIGLYPAGFNPYPGRKYVFSAWVKDNQPASQSPGITLTVNGQGVTLKKLAVVEKWKLVEGTITLPDALNLTVTITPVGGTVYLDDMRVFPFDAHVKSYAYDAGDLRLMAELDENNFATFYEYDDEGGLVRMKKETERGIMTIKENRSAAKRN